MINPPKKEEEEEILDKEEEPKEIFEDETKESNIEIVIEPKEQEEPEPEPEPVKPKRTRKKKEMTEASKKQLEEARIKSLEKRRANAQKRKQEQEEKELTNKKYIDEIELLKQQINELKINNKPKVIEKEKTNDESEYKFSLQDLEFYAESYMKKHKQIEDEVKHKRNKQVRDKYFLQLR